MATGRERLEGGIWKGAMGRGATIMGRGWQWGGGQHDEEMERGAMGKLGGKMGRWQWGGERGRDGEGKRRGKRTGDFTDGYDGTPGWT